MTDFYSVLQRAIGSLPDGSGPQRRAVYDKARKALLKQLQSFDPPLPSSDVTAQRLALEDAIRKIENEIARQIRTRRAVQGAMPAAGAARTAAPAALPQRPVATPPMQPPAPVPLAVPLEEETGGPDKDELLASAVSEATVQQPEPEPEPDPPGEPEAFEEAPIERIEAPEVPVPVTEVVYEEVSAGETSAAVQAAAPIRARAADEQVVDGEFDEITDETDLAEQAPVPVRAERRERRRPTLGRRSKRVAPVEPRPKREWSGAAGRSTIARVALPLVVLALLAGAAYAAYAQREALLAVLFEERPDRAPIVTEASPEVVKNSDRLPSTLDGEDTRSVTTTTVPAPAPQTADPSASDTPSAVPPADGAADGARVVDGEAASAFAADPTETPAQEQVARATETLVDDSPAADAAAAEAAAEAVPQGPISEFVSQNRQQAMLYEEAAQTGEAGVAVNGSVEWSMVRQAVGGGSPEPVVRANAAVEDRGLQATLTIRENTDDALPASHLIEIAFEVPDGFEGGGVKNVPGIIMKQSEGDRGNALAGAAARVSSGLFWIALSEDEAQRDENLRLLRERDWIDIPILYESGRRAILTLRKGSDGLQSVNAALQAWSSG